MSKFKYMEYAISSPQNRGHFNYSTEVIKMPFEQNNRFKEYWRSMFVYESANPKEEDSMFGNFYIECDEEDFNLNKNIMIDVVRYISNTYSVPYSYFDFFLTNRSIWMSLPAKVLGCFGSKKLNIIYKEMASEVNNHIINKGYSKGLDLSIYKWNGLIHSLGSYLANSKRWVSKFTFSDLDYSYKKEDLFNVKYDNLFTISDMEVIPKANSWYLDTKNKVFKIKTNETKNETNIIKKINRPCMQRLEELGLPEENRNLHIYTYALYLKELGFNIKDSIERVQVIFKNPYVFTKECERTIKSAIDGKKNFNCNYIKEVLSKDIMVCEENSCKINNKSTFIVPRIFIEKLHKAKSHYNAYKYLIKILYSKQIENKNFSMDLNGLRHKKETISIFENLSNLGFISYTYDNNIIKTEIIYQENIYKSHIVIPKCFVTNKNFLCMKAEIKLLMELCRSSLYISNGIHIFNVKLKNLCKKINTTLKSLSKYLILLKKYKFILDKNILLNNNIRIYKKIISKLVNKYKNIKTYFSLGQVKYTNSNKEISNQGYVDKYYNLNSTIIDMHPFQLE